MAKRNKTASQAAAIKVVETTPQNLKWEALSSTSEVIENKPSPFAGKAVSGKKSVPVSLIIWAAGKKINPDIYQNDTLNFCIKDNLPYNAWKQFVELLEKYMDAKDYKFFAKQKDLTHENQSAGYKALKEEFVELVKNG